MTNILRKTRENDVQELDQDRAFSFAMALACLLVLATAVPVEAQPAPLHSSLDWALAMPSGPDARVKITEEYARLVACEAYFWAWPMINVYNRRLAFSQVPEPGLMGGVLPVAPLNRLAMLHDYILPNQRFVACPNQDVVYGAALLALEVSPVVVQVPDFGGRFRLFEVSDIRTDNFGTIGARLRTAPRLAPITLCERRLLNRTYSSTRRTKRTIFIKTLMRTANGLMAPIVTP
jgi:Protein of unknown function (DUF1254)